MAGIITRNLSVTGEGNNKHLILRNGSVSRGLAIGNNWEELAVMMRCRIPAVANIAGDPELVIGVAYGLSGWENPINAWGLKLIDATSLTRNTSGGYSYLYHRGYPTYAYIKRGGTEVENDWSNQYCYCFMPVDTSHLISIGAYFKKPAAGGNLNTYYFGWDHSSASDAVTLEDLIYALEQPTPLGLRDTLNLVNGNHEYQTAHGQSYMTTTDLAEATYGGMDSVFVHWSHNDPPLEIADIVVAKWS